MVPVFEYRQDGGSLSYRWSNVVDGFDMPVRVAIGDVEYALLRPSQEWQSVSAAGPISVNENFYVEVREVR